MTKTLSNTLRIFICSVFTLQLMGCGTLMYPERRGQRGGSLDAGVAVLDGIGLLFGIIPGVIAFAVDFSNGTIYLPEHRDHLSSLDVNNFREIKFDPKYSSLASVENIVRNETGCKFNGENVRFSKLRSLNDMKVQFAKADINNDRIALL